MTKVKKTKKKKISEENMINVPTGYIYKNITLKLRSSNFVQYRIPSIEFKRDYEKFKYGIVDKSQEESLRKEVMKNDTLLKLALSKKEIKEAEIAKEIIDSNSDAPFDFAFFNMAIEEINEEYLIKNDLENSKKMFDIIFENANEMDYSSNGEDEYNELYTFILRVFNDFFIKKQKRKLT